ncbi:hypothetical protein EQV77_09515 [Halobacillus fulvus]|nr:hypothetical protein EQV77_09515 [Halobacillus fulvus]
MGIRYNQCPKCRSRNTVDILYGMPTAEAFQKAEKGLLKLGGCTIMPGQPNSFCNDCENEWTSLEAVDFEYSKIRGIKASAINSSDQKWMVEIDFETREVKWNGTFQRVMEQTELDTFKERLKWTKVLDWKAKYGDGADWWVEISREGRNVERCGKGSYPSQWEEFVEVLSEVTMRGLY